MDVSGDAPSGGWEAVTAQMAAYHRQIAERAAQARKDEPARPSSLARGGQLGLSEAEQAQVDTLRARDREVRDHEQAHARVGGPYAGQPSYTYQAGPDGQRYAVGGEVPIDAAPVEGDPEATVAKMDIVKAAALAPAEPSGADRQVAALADATRAQALADLAAVRRAQAAGDVDQTA